MAQARRQDRDFIAARLQLMAEIEAEVRETRSWTGRAALGPRVKAALAKVPRHEFVRDGDAAQAYLNRPLGIGHGQTISQPYIVAIMTELLDLEADDVVLEVGTGSAYQTAVLAELAARVYSIEVVAELAEAARAKLARLGHANVEVRSGDGHRGWPEAAPFDAVIVTAAAERLPPALIAQLKPGGRLVIPIGRPHGPQMLHRGVKGADGAFASSAILPVAFVPMIAARNRA